MDKVTILWGEYLKYVDDENAAFAKLNSEIQITADRDYKNAVRRRDAILKKDAERRYAEDKECRAALRKYDSLPWYRRLFTEYPMPRISRIPLLPPVPSPTRVWITCPPLHRPTVEGFMTWRYENNK